MTSYDSVDDIEGPFISFECPDMRLIIDGDKVDSVKLKELDYIEIELRTTTGDSILIRNDDETGSYRLGYSMISDFLRRIKKK